MGWLGLAGAGQSATITICHHPRKRVFRVRIFDAPRNDAEIIRRGGVSHAPLEPVTRLAEGEARRQAWTPTRSSARDCTAFWTSCSLVQWLSFCEIAGCTKFGDRLVIRAKCGLLRFRRREEGKRVYAPFIAILKLPFKFDRS